MNSPAVPVPDLQGALILIVDDDEDFRFLASTILQRAGAQVATAADGAEAIAAVREFAAGQREYAAIVMDLQMPQQDGWETAVQLRQQGYTRPLVMVTADVFTVAEPPDQPGIADLWLEKPLDKSAFVRALTALIRRERWESE